MPHPATKRVSPILACLLAIGTLAAASNAQAQSPNPNQLLDDVQDFYDKARDFKSSFEQAHVDIAADKTTKSKGYVYFKKPGLMRWDYLDASGNLQKTILVTKNDITVYDAALNQFYRTKISPSKASSAIPLLMGAGNLKQDFKASLGKKAAAGTHKLVLTPKKSIGKFKRIVLVIDARTSAIREIIFEDPYGNSNQLTFDNSKINLNLPNSGFIFTPPPGATQIHP